MRARWHRLLCRLGIHRPTVSLYAVDGDSRLKLTVRLRCAWGCGNLDVEDSINMDKRSLQGVCGVLSMGGIGCQKQSGHGDRHYNAAYGEWSTSLTIPVPRVQDTRQ